MAKRRKQKPKRTKATKPNSPSIKIILVVKKYVAKIKTTSSKLELIKVNLVNRAEKYKLKLQIVFFIFFTLFLISADSWLNTERKVFDWLTFFNSVPEESKQVVIVKIDENDFSRIFEKRSPLDPNRVTEIIGAISTGKPKVLGVDILTSDEIHRQYVSKDYGFPIVWASEPIKKDGKFVEIKPPLAGQNLALNNYSALPESVKDPDGVNRICRRIWNVNEQSYPTFAWQIYKLAYPHEAESKAENAEDYYIRFTGNSDQEVTAGEVLDWLEDERRQHLEDKIVILGGMYGDARDMQLIPFENVFGVQLNATIIETEIHGNPQKPISGLWKMFLNIIAFPLFAIIFFRYNFIKALITALILLTLTILSISFFKYGVSSLIFLIPVFLWTIALASLDLIMDKYKEVGSRLVDLVQRKSS